MSAYSALGAVGPLVTTACGLLVTESAAAGVFGAWQSPVNPIVPIQMAQNTSGAATSATVTVTFASNVTVGNVVVLSIHYRNAATTSSVVGLGATFTQQANYNSGNLAIAQIYSGQCVTAGTTITVTISGAQPLGVVAQEFAGMTPNLDAAGAGVNGPGSGTLCDTGNVTSTNPMDLLFGAGTFNGSQTLVSGPTNGFTQLGSVSAMGSGGNHITMMAAYNIVNVAASYSTSWTMSGSNAVTGGIIAMKSKYYL